MELGGLRAALCAAGLFFIPASAPAAQDIPKRVYQIDPWVDGGIIAVAGLASVLPWLNEESLITRRCPCNPGELEAWDRPAIGLNNFEARMATEYIVGAALLGPVLLDWADLGWSRAFAEDMVVYAEVLAVNNALVTLAKYGSQRPLPRVYAGQDPELAIQAGGYRAFYSGHTANAFAALSAASITQNLRYGFSPWPWVLTVVAGTAAGLGRVADGRHFYSDVVVGALAGTAVGVLVPWMHRLDSALALKPLDGGLQLSVRQDF